MSKKGFSTTHQVKFDNIHYRCYGNNMYRKLIEKAKYRHVMYTTSIFLAALAALIVFGFEKYLSFTNDVYARSSSETIQNLIKTSYSSYAFELVVTMLTILILAILITVLVCVAKKQGFEEGYKKGLHLSSSSKVN